MRIDGSPEFVEDRTQILVCTAYAAAVCVAMGMMLYVKGIWFASNDDFYRIQMAMHWAAHPFFAPADAYWLPLPHCFYGAWFRTIGRYCGVAWHVPAATFLMALASSVNVCVTWLLVRSLPRPARINACLLGAFFPVLLPVAWRVSASALSEPLQLLAQSVMMACILTLCMRPSRRAWSLLAASLLALQMTRYEAWTQAFVVFLVALLGARGLSTPRRLALLPVAACFLAAFPILWMALNHQVHGNAFHFLDQAREQAKSGLLVRLPLGEQLGALALLALCQGLPLVPFALAGVWAGRRERNTRCLVALGALLLTAYMLPALSSTTASACPQRLSLAVWWLVIPLAAAGASMLCTRGILLRGVVVGVLLAAVCFQCSLAGWSESSDFLLRRKDYEQLLRIRKQALAGKQVVIMAQDAEKYPIMGIVRVFVQPQPVILRNWSIPPELARAERLYFSRAKVPPSAPRVGTLLSFPYYRLPFPEGQ